MAEHPEETTIGERLNEVREKVGAKDLKSFYAILNGDRGQGFPSYPAIATYHGAPWREPPLAYLTRILERFEEINPEWLITGRGERTRAAEQLKIRKVEEGASNEIDEQTQALRDTFERAVPGLPRWGLAMDSLWDLWQTILESPAVPRTLRDARAWTAAEYEIQVAKRIGEGVGRTLEAILGIEPKQVNPMFLTSYVVGLTRALQQAWWGATIEPISKFELLKAAREAQNDARKEEGQPQEPSR